MAFVPLSTINSGLVWILLPRDCMSLGFLSLSFHISKTGVIRSRGACHHARHGARNVIGARNTLSIGVLTSYRIITP